MTLVGDARQLLASVEPLVDAETVETLRAARRRLDEPLRVAIAGRVKSGKSTMLNAIIGQAAAATDAAECTRAITWYVDGTAYLAWACGTDGSRRQVPYHRTDTKAVVDLTAEDLAAIERVEVDFPSSHLRTMTLIDTPGISSVSEKVSERTLDFLVPERGDQGADVVVYLLRHVHERDSDFLEAFTDPSVAAVGGIRSIAVLSRADDVGNGRGDALHIARRVADRYAAHPVLKTRVADVLPVAGLLAFAAATHTEAEYTAFRELASLGQLELEQLLVSVDRFTAESRVAPVSVEARRALLDRYGLFGVRLSTSLIRSGQCDSAGALAGALEQASGIRPLRRLLLNRFAGRAELLKAARAIDLVNAIADRAPAVDAKIRGDLERVAAGSHELAELRCLAEIQDLTDDEIHLPDTTRRHALAVLGSDGTEPWQRLSLDQATPTADLVAAARQLVAEFRTARLDPEVDRPARRILSVAERSAEAVHFELVGNTATE